MLQQLYCSTVFQNIDDKTGRLQTRRSWPSTICGKKNDGIDLLMYEIMRSSFSATVNEIEVGRVRL